MRAVIYCRISSDRGGEGLGVARQEQDCRALADREHWEVVGVLVDNDRSAYSGAPRPGYQQLLGMLKEQAVDVVVAWHPDRLHRSPRELEDFIDLLDAADATVATVTAGAVDLASPAGRMTARVVGAVARHESEHKSERLRRKAVELAEAGNVGGGGTRPFGYEPDRVTIRESEAFHIRAAVDRVLAGATLRSVLLDWNENGVAPVQADRWAATTLRNMLTRPRLAGLREHRGRVVGRAVWEGIITVEQHERLVAMVEARSRRRGPNRTYLLTGGIAVCGLCGTQLYAQPKGDGRRCYCCIRDHGGCGRIKTLAEPIEDLVVDLMLAAAAAGRFATVDSTADERTEVLAEIEDLAQRQDALAVDRYTTGDLADLSEGRRYRAAAQALDQKLTAARIRLAALDTLAGHIGTRNTAEGLSERWAHQSASDRRQVTATLVHQVIVGPAVAGRNYFDPFRIRVDWAL